MTMIKDGRPAQTGGAWRKDGIFSGYPEYRYGSARPITLAGPKPQKALFPAGKRRHLIEMLRRELRDWQFTPFEQEGPMRHALRSWMCLMGYGWTPSDEEAAFLVSRVLQKIGARRPSWEEGQSRHTDSRDFCSWCRTPFFKVAGSGKAEKFCSVQCGIAAFKKREFQQRTNYDKSYAAARRALLRGRTKPRTCLECNATFTPISEASKQECCSIGCGAVRRARLYPRITVSKTCEFCGETFVAEPRAQCCSKGCLTARWKLQRGMMPRELTWRVFDHFVAVPAMARPYPRPLTPEMFDKLFGRAA